MSAATAREFLTDLRNGRSPIVAAGDEDGTVQIKFEITESGPIFSVHQPGERCASTSNRNFEGRQGRGGRTHLVSPMMAAAAAITGHFTDIRNWKFNEGHR